MKLFAESFEKVLKKIEKTAHKDAMKIHKEGILKKDLHEGWQIKVSRDDWQPRKVIYYIEVSNPNKFFEEGREEVTRRTLTFSFKKYPAEWHDEILQAYEETFEEDLLGYRMHGGLAVLKSEA